MSARKRVRVRCSSRVDWPVFSRLRRNMRASTRTRNLAKGLKSRHRAIGQPLRSRTRCRRDGLCAACEGTGSRLITNCSRFDRPASRRLRDAGETKRDRASESDHARRKRPIKGRHGTPRRASPPQPISPLSLAHSRNFHARHGRRLCVGPAQDVLSSGRASPRLIGPQ